MKDSPIADFDHITQYRYKGSQVKYNDIFRFPLTNMGGLQNQKITPTLKAYSTKSIAFKLTIIDILRDSVKLCMII